jgi:hypothetical protein
MNILKNKHLILAMFVAPVLAIIAYFSVDFVVSEKPQAAVEGAAYKLAARSNCRYQSGACTLKNGDIEVHLHARRIDDKTVELKMQSELPVQNAIISHVVGELASNPVEMITDVAADGELAADRYVILKLSDPENTRLRMALSIADTMYYAETTAVFVDYETSFSRDNFSE